MKKLVTHFVILVASLVLLGCGDKTKEPLALHNKLATALEKKDFGFIFDSLTIESQEWALDFISGVSEYSPDVAEIAKTKSGRDLFIAACEKGNVISDVFKAEKITKLQVNGDEAIIMVEGDPFPSMMIRENGDWKFKPKFHVLYGMKDKSENSDNIQPKKKPRHITEQILQADVTGQIFVVTQSGENIKMGGLEVLVIPDSEFQAMAKTTVSWMQEEARAEAQQKIDSDYMANFIRQVIEVEQKGPITIPEMERIRMSILDESDTKKNYMEPGIPNDLVHRGFSKLISTSTSPIIVSTDADGRFTVPTKGKIWFIARGQRRLGYETEHYLWLKSYEPINGSTMPTTSISNDSDIESEGELYEILTNVIGGAGFLHDFQKVEVSVKMKSIVKKHSELVISAKAKAESDAAEAKTRLTEEVAAVRIGAKLDIPIAGKIIMQFALCPAGSFTMGSPTTETGHRYDEKQVIVTLSKAFWMAKTEVSQAQWCAVMGRNPSCHVGDDLPVNKVGWDSAQEFIKKVNDSGLIPEGWKMTLPTEAQWEYACRAGTTTALNSGKDIKDYLKLCPNLDEVAWHGDNSGGNPHPVGTKKPNAWGLYDMHGNIVEWCQDWYSITNDRIGGTDPYTSPLGAGGRASRGGGFGSNRFLCGGARRGIGDYPHIGFRPVLVPSEMIAIQEDNEAKKDANY